MIIGVVASMTIPSILANTTRVETVARVKKSYSSLNNAYNLAVENYGAVQFWGVAADSAEQLNRLAQYLNVEKNCGVQKGCFPNVMYNRFDGQPDKNFENTDIAKARLADGTLLGISKLSSDCTFVTGRGDLQYTCSWIYIDTNGYKSPNVLGKDMFLFYLTRNGVIPAGTPGDTSYPLNRHYGWGYTAWIIIKENMDYLSKDVAW